MKTGTRYLGDGRCEFTVWAPNSDAVAVQIVSPHSRQIPMQQHPGGYWQVTATDIEPGTLYLYQLNNGEARPDPASYFQPEGVHKASQVIDQSFTWNDGNWSGVPLEAMIIYELHVGTFTPSGTFEAIIPRLRDLRELGVTAIELMPIAQFPGDQPTENPHAYRNWGYDGVYLFAVQNSYGGPLGLKRLVEACHQEGIAVVLDVVYNHFGPEGNYISLFGPYFTETYRTPWGSAINFDDALSHHVRSFFIQNALYWLEEYHIDALRLDAVHAIYDLGAKHFLEELTENVAALSKEQGRKLYLIAESDLNNARIIRPAELGGYGIDAQWSDDFHHALHSLLTGDNNGYYEDFGKCEHLAKAYQDTFVYDWQYAPHRRRFHGNSAGDRGLTQFVVCIQNHDQIGNQLLGERLSQLVSFDALKLAAGAVLLSPYIPLLFMGEEYGEEVPFTYFVSHADADLIKAVRQGRKAEFAAFHVAGEPPDPESSETFLKCKLNWEKRKEGKHFVLWSFYQHLIQLRNTIPALVKRERQNLEVGFQEAEKLVWWRRWSDDNQILCLMNFNQSDITFQPNLTSSGWKKLLDSADEQWQGSGSLLPEKINSGQELTLRSQSFALYESF
ncbi:MAG: malto-oligosyltrehalose trehalohydrolase [Stigonema ocellatum SAG 48.90 = DSM 106950]|nr:malto-oligosyltrehalose trehalohydrolase [Stigonema ocellatum SAG 48.90 = DSM 106950]